MVSEGLFVAGGGPKEGVLDVEEGAGEGALPDEGAVFQF